MAINKLMIVPVINDKLTEIKNVISIEEIAIGTSNTLSAYSGKKLIDEINQPTMISNNITNEVREIYLRV